MPEFALRLPSALALVALTFLGPVRAEGLPSGMVFSGLTESGWGLYVQRPDTGLTRAPTRSEPRTPAISAGGERIAYVDADGALREYRLEGGTEAVRLAAAPQRGLTHPVYDGEDRLLAVWLKDGTSVDTDIVRAGDSDGLDVVLPQRSAQFEPALDVAGAIYYSNVACTVACGRVIQEIWRYRPVSGRAERLTNLNAVARQPYVGPDGAIYFSSNADGPFHIWRVPTGGGKAHAVTDGTGVDTWPVVTADGTLYFLRQGPERVALMRRAPDAGTAHPVDRGRSFDNLKDLRLSRCATAC